MEQDYDLFIYLCHVSKLDENHSVSYILYVIIIGHAYISSIDMKHKFQSCHFLTFNLIEENLKNIHFLDPVNFSRCIRCRQD